MSKTKGYHIYTLAQYEYLINAKLPSANIVEMEKFLNRFIKRFQKDSDWNTAPRANALRQKAIKLQSKANDMKIVDRYLDQYLGKTVKPIVIERVTVQINKKTYESFTPEQVQQQLEHLTEQAGGSDKLVVDGSLTPEPTQTSPTKPKTSKKVKGSRHKYTDEQNIFLLSEGLKIATIMTLRTHAPTLITLHTRDIRRIKGEFNEKFGLDLSLPALGEKIRALIKRHSPKTPEPRLTTIVEAQKPEPTSKKNRPRWEVIERSNLPKSIWKGEFEPSVEIVKSVKKNSLGKKMFRILINNESMWIDDFEPIVLKCELC